MSAWTLELRRDAVDAMLSRAPVLPILTIERVQDAVPLARALVEAGLPVLEVTLRTEASLPAIERIAREVPEAIVGAGTVLTPVQLATAIDAGAVFAISPGATEVMYTAAAGASIPFIPAIATASELMRGLELEHVRFKFFAAESVGGLAALRAFAAPFPHAKFCPTGGIDGAKAPAYLAMPNVVTVGGSWMVPKAALDAGDWAAIGKLARACTTLRSGGVSA